MPANVHNGLRKPSAPARRLTSDELNFLKAILRRESVLLTGLEDVLVQDMADGGMGSLYFVGAGGSERKLGRCAVEAEFQDRDGVLVSVVVNLDDQNHLFELDILKVDFSPLIEFPDKQDIAIKAAQSE